jgi:hypothetical protein
MAPEIGSKDLAEAERERVLRAIMMVRITLSFIPFFLYHISHNFYRLTWARPVVICARPPIPHRLSQMCRDLNLKD